MKSLISIIVFTLAFQLSFTQYDRQIGNLFEEGENRPGGIIGIFEDGEITFEKAFGLANLDYDIPITAETVFDVGSVAKQFTAACIFLLEQQGKLSIDDPIQKYLPEMPVFNDEIVTIRHLINHTSGLRDYVEITSYAGIPFENIFTEEMGLNIMARQKERSFPPGQQFMYNNGGYLLLAIIIRRVSGVSIGTFAQRNIFEPLGMNSTFILENPNRIVKNSATGYVPVSDSTYEKQHYYNIALGGDGQVYTNLGDLLLWDNNFYDHKVGGKVLYNRQHERGVLINGDTIEYAGGLFIQENNGYPVVQHTGSWAGFRAVLYRLPSLNRTLIVMANTPDFLDRRKFFALMNLIVPKQEAEPSSIEASMPKTEAVNLSANQLDKYTGLFVVKGQPHLRLKSELVNDTLKITQQWDGLSYQLLPTSSTSFFRKDFNIIRFEFDKNSGLPIIYERLEVLGTEKAQDFQAETPLTEYVGEYYSPEVGVSYHIEIVDEGLQVVRNGDILKTLNAVSKDVFGQGIQGFQFLRENEKVTSFLIQDRRVRNLEFVKKMDK